MISREHANDIADAKIAQWEGLREFDTDVGAMLGDGTTGFISGDHMAAQWADKEKQDQWLNDDLLSDPNHYHSDAMLYAEYKKLDPKPRVWFKSEAYYLALERVVAHWESASSVERRALLDAQIKSDVDEAAQVRATVTALFSATRVALVYRFKKQMDALVHLRVSAAELTWTCSNLFGLDEDDSDAETI